MMAALLFKVFLLIQMTGCSRSLFQFWFFSSPSPCSFALIMHTGKTKFGLRQLFSTLDITSKWSYLFKFLFICLQSRPIFNKSTRFEDMRNFEDERTSSFRRPSLKKYVDICDFCFIETCLTLCFSNLRSLLLLSDRPISKGSGMQSRDDDLDLAEFSQ